ncbi:hypothetical protein P4S72_02005 [Vibrio sp. PP-XX7]
MKVPAWCLVRRQNGDSCWLDPAFRCIRPAGCARSGDDEDSILSQPNGPSGNPISPWWFGSMDDWHQAKPQALLPGKAVYHTGVTGTKESTEPAE